MSDKPRRGMTLEEVEPPYEDPSRQPKTLTRTRHIDDVLYVAGRSPVKDQEEYDIMFVTSAVEPDEATTHAASHFGMSIKQPAEYLKGPNGIIKDVALRAGVDIDKCYYTAVCKWLLPKPKLTKPSKQVMRWGIPVLEDEIKRVKPKIIVCLGKPVFDLLHHESIKFKDAHGCWFWNEDYQAHMYVMHKPYTLVGNPEHYETFRIDFKEIARRKEILDSGGNISGHGVDYQVLRSTSEVQEWLDHVEELSKGDEWPGLRDDYGNPLMAVDCEWHGKTHLDGQLRTMQLAWTENDAVVIEFRNENNEWSFESGGIPNRNVCTGATLRAEDGAPLTEAVEYGIVGKPIAETFERMNVRYIGHHYPADSPWMKHWLGMEIYERCALDTEFAQQTCDESSELGLERGVAMKYTNLGRYDQELVMWKRANKEKCRDGYGYIPSSILHPYGAKDVCVPYRAYPLIKRQLEAQRLWEYYRDTFNPFVTDVFSEFTMGGLPMDVPMMDDLRSLFSWTVTRLNKKLQERIAAEARDKFKSKILTEFGIKALKELSPAVDARDEKAMKNGIKVLLAEKGNLREINAWNPKILHVVSSPDFNLRSPDQMARWLFDFEGLTPIKSTSQKAKGLPSMAWENVLKLPPDKQALYKPAVDKQTLSILSEQLDAIDELLDLNAVGNLSKAFLKEPTITINEDGDEVIDENGLHSWLCSDDRIHGQMSTTETGRPRCLSGDCLVLVKPADKRVKRNRLIPLRDVTLADRVWDGEDWVIHDGVVEQGVQRTYEYQGLWATLNHQVMVYDDSAAEMGLGIGDGSEPVRVMMTSFGDAIENAWDLVDGQTGLDVTPLDRYDGIPEQSVGVDPGYHPNRMEMTYDLINAGPNRRFTCSSYLVSNSWAPNTLNYPSYVNKRIAKTIEKVIKEAHEEGDLPEHLMKWVGVSGDKLPSIRSCIKAPEGYIFVESDYATAEMVALAIISGDVDLMRLLFEPDPDWVKLKPGHPSGEGVVRVKFSDPKATGIPVESCREEYLMNVWVDGEHKGEVTKDQLLIDAEGNPVHAKFDIHWSLIERTYGKCRESMKAKVDRAGAKVLNFCCPGYSEVLTQVGDDTKAVSVTPLAEVSTLHKVWDGAAWTRHEGVIKQGHRGVIEYDGFQATPEHVVYTEGHGAVPLVDAAMQGLRLFRSAEPDSRYVDPDHDINRRDEERKILTDRVQFLRALFSSVDEQFDAVRRSATLRVPPLDPEIRGRSAGESLGLPLRVDGSTLQERYACIIAQLQRARDRGADGARRVHTLGVDPVASTGDSEQGLRSDRQRRALRADEPTTYNTVGEPKEYAQVQELSSESLAGSMPKASATLLLPEDSSEQAAAGDERGGHTTRRGFERGTMRSRQGVVEYSEGSPLGCREPKREVVREIHRRALEEGQGPSKRVDQESQEADAGQGSISTQPHNPEQVDLQASLCSEAAGAGHDRGRDSEAPQDKEGVEAPIRVVGFMEVYDILNAGPRHRFTCSGVLVSNSSAYGATATSLERKIESDTGVKPDEGTGERGLEAIQERQPRATQFLEDMARVPKEKGMFRAASGRIRHCLMHGAGSGVGWRTRNSIESALGREMRNFPCQESVGATSARACKWLMKAYRNLGLKSRITTCLYDSVVSLCPLGERFLVARLHNLCMSEMNTWDYKDELGERTLQYTIDNEFNWRWSTRPPKDEQKTLDDRSYYPPAKKHTFLENHPMLRALAGLTDA